MSRTDVYVTQEDIDKARRNHSSRCVVATAIKRAVPAANHVKVDMQTIRWTTPNERVVYVTPGSVMDYIINFDAGDEIKPFTFRLLSEQKATIPAVRRNQAAKKVQAAKARARTAETRKRKVAASPTASRAEKKVAAEKATASQKKLAQVKATEGPKASTTKRKGDATHYRIPVHAKTGDRYYGMNALRINQDRQKLEHELAQAQETIERNAPTTPRRSRPSAAKSASSPAPRRSPSSGQARSARGSGSKTTARRPRRGT